MWYGESAFHEIFMLATRTKVLMRFHVLAVSTATSFDKQKILHAIVWVITTSYCPCDNRNRLHSFNLSI